MGAVGRPQQGQAVYKGLMRIKTPDEVTREIEAAEQPVEETQIDYGAIRHSFVAGEINKAWMRNKMARQTIDTRLLACLRMRKGVYSDRELSEIIEGGANSTIYMTVAATKCRALSAWIKEILMAPGDRACGLEPRPIPDLPKEVKAMIIKGAAQKARQIMTQAAQAGGEPMSQEDFHAMAFEMADQMESEVKQMARERAERAAEKMEDAIFQDMDDGDFDLALGDFIEYFSTYMTAILKGPFLKRSKSLTWGPGFEPIVTSKVGLGWSAVSPFDAYPAPLAATAQDRAFIERLRMTETQLYDMIGVPGTDEEAVRWVLANHQVGLLRNWIWTDAERQRLEGDTNYNWFAQDDTIDALHYWGSLSGRCLEAWGVKGITDPEKFYEVDAIMIGTRVIRCVINSDPLGRRPYRIASYEKVPGSFWGRAVPELCESHQDMANAAARALANNMGFASGPMVGVNIDRIPTGEDIESMFPYKIWQFTNDETGSSGNANRPLEFFQPESNAAELMQIFDKFEEKADDATGIPRYTYGDDRVGGAGSTAQGLSMLMGAAAKGVRRAITEIDVHVLAETTYDAFIHNMLHNPDPQIKGDCNIVPRGSNALLIKESMQQGRMQALQLLGSSPMYQSIVGMKHIAEILGAYLKGLHLPNVVPDGPELDQLVAQIMQQQAQAAQQPSPAAIAAKSSERVEAAKNATKERIAGAQIAVSMQRGAHAQAQQGRGGIALPAPSQPGLPAAA